MRPLLLLLFLLSLMSVSAQTQEDPSSSTLLPIPAGGYWIGADSLFDPERLSGGAFTLLTYWNVGDPDVQLLERELAAALSDEPYFKRIGIHIPLSNNQKNKELLRRKVIEYGLPPLQYNDTSDHYGLTASELPLVLMMHPDGGTRVLRKGNDRYFEESDNISTYLLLELAEAKKEYNRPGKTLFPSYRREQAPSVEKYGLLSHPSAVEVDADADRIFICDTGHDRIIVTSSRGQVIMVIGTGKKGHQDGDVLSARFDTPQDMSYDPVLQRLYVADTGNERIRMVDLIERKVTTLLGDGRRDLDMPDYSNDPLIGLDRPNRIQLDGNRLIICMGGTGRIYTFNLGTTELTRIVGSGAKSSTMTKKWKKLPLAEPSGLVYSDSNKPIFVDAQVPRLYTTKGKRTVALIDSDQSGAAKDGDFENSRLARPEALVRKDGDILLIDSYQPGILKIDMERQRTTWLELGPGDSLVSPSDVDRLNGRYIIADKGAHQVITSDGKLLQGLKLTGVTPLIFGALDEIGALNITEPINILEEGQTTIEMTFDLPEDYTWNFDEKSSMYSPARDGVVMSSTVLGDEPVLFTLFGEEARRQLTIRGELHFCDVERPSRCYVKMLNVAIPIEKTDVAEPEQKLTIDLLKELDR